MAAMNARLLRPRASGGGFTPQSIAGLGVWLDASDLSTLSQTSDGSTPVTSDDDPVGYWRCKASGTPLTQSIDASRPLWKSASDVGSKPGLDFDGGDYLFATSGELMKMARNVPGVTIFAVLRTDDTFNRAWWHASIGAGTNQFRARVSGGYIAGFFIGGRRTDADTFSTTTTSALSTLADYILRQTNDYANSDIFAHVNGTQRASSTSFHTDGNSEDADSAYVMVGNQFTNDSFTGIVSGFNGTLCEWIAYRRVLSAAESASVEGYLSSKYGIALE